MKTHVVKLESGDSIDVEMPASKGYPKTWRYHLLLEDFDRYTVNRVHILGRDGTDVDIWVGDMKVNSFGMGVV